MFLWQKFWLEGVLIVQSGQSAVISHVLQWTVGFVQVFPHFNLFTEEFYHRKTEVTRGSTPISPSLWPHITIPALWAEGGLFLFNLAWHLHTVLLHRSHFGVHPIYIRFLCIFQSRRNSSLLKQYSNHICHICVFTFPLNREKLWKMTLLTPFFSSHFLLLTDVSLLPDCTLPHYFLLFLLKH